MCDEFTADDASGLTRRSFATLGGAAAAIGIGMTTGMTGIAAGGAEPSAAAPTESTVVISTASGTADAFFVHPNQGTHPGIVLWPDIGGLRDAYKVMARRLGAAGYAVLAVNQYYRNTPAPVFTSFAQWRTPEGQAKLAPMIAGLTPQAVADDASAYVEFLDSQPAVDRGRRIGSVGYCMGGPFAVRTAAAVPTRVGAAASCHGASLVTDKPDSPHRLIAATLSSYLFAIAQGDDTRAPGDKDVLRTTAAAAHRPAEVEVYPAEHSWCTIDSPVYDPVQADRAYGRVLALFAAL